MNSRVYVALAIFATFLFFAGYTFFIFHLDTTFPEIDLVCSAPSPIVPDTTQDLAVTALHRGSLRPAEGLGLEMVARMALPSRTILGRFPLVERKPGVYSARFLIPAMTREGDISFSICPAGRPQQTLCGFTQPSSLRPALAAIPPNTTIHAGDSVRIRVSMLDRETALPIPHLPLRAIVTSPDGLEIANRLCPLNSSGSGLFRFRLHSLGPTGIWKVAFQAGNTRLGFSIPVHPSLPLSVRWTRSLHHWLAETGNQWLPAQWRMWLIPNLPPAPDWQLASTTLPLTPRSAFSLSQSKKHLRIRLNPAARRTSSYLEIWKGTHLMGSRRIPAGRRPISLSLPLPSQGSLPLRFVLWTRKGTQIRRLGEQQWFARTHPTSSRLQRTTVGWETFLRLAAISSPAGKPANEILSRLFSGSGPFLQVFQVSLRPHVLITHLEMIAQAILILFPLVFAFGLGVILWTLPRAIPASTPTYSILGQFLAISLVLYGFYLFGLQASRHIGIPISFLILFVFAMVTRQWLVDDVLRSYTRLSSSFALMGLYMALLMLLGQTVERLGLWDSMIPPLTFQILVSLISVPIFFLIIGLLHLEHLPRRVFEGCSTILAKLFWPLTTGSFSGLGLQIVALGLFFYLVLQVPQRLSIPSLSLLETEGLSPGNLATHRSPPLNFTEFRQAGKLPSFQSPVIPFSASGTSLLHRRFFLLEGRLPWHGQRIDSLRIFQTPRDYLDRIISAFPSSRRDFHNLCVEFLARSERFERMNEGEQVEEGLRLEALLGPITHVLSSSDMNRSSTLSPSDLGQVLQVLERAGKIIGIDPTLRKSFQRMVPCPLPHGSGIELTLVFDDGRLKTVDLFHPLRNPECFRTGGSLQLAGSRNRVPFTLHGETLVLNRGISFRPDFEFRSIEPRREEPILIEIEQGTLRR